MATRTLTPLTRRALVGTSTTMTTRTLTKPSAKPTTSSLSTQKVAPKAKTSSNSERKENEWGRCKTCSREYKKTTLERTDYVCTTCTKKAQRGETGTKKNNGKCEGSCGKEYTKATLKKWENMCKKCYDAAKSGGNADEMVSCSACERDTSKKIFDLNSGFCHTCTMLVMQFYYTDALLNVVGGKSEDGVEDGEGGGEEGAGVEGGEDN